ncbi:hypothetical protein MJ579_13250 [Klebsiella pneumoniae]|nr:hypothetical protein MJ579_13250 [Klebsiella pneumoniae]
MTASRKRQKFDPHHSPAEQHQKREPHGQPGIYQIIPTPAARTLAANGAATRSDERTYHRLSFADKQLWVTRYHPDRAISGRGIPGTVPLHDNGLGQYAKDDESLTNHDDVVITTGTTHVARAEEWPIMPTEWAQALLKPWNFDENPTLGEKKKVI